MEPTDVAEAPFSQEPVEREVHVNDDETALGLEELHVVHDLHPPPVYVEDSLPHQVLVREHPPRLVRKRRMGLSLGREDGHHPFLYA